MEWYSGVLLKHGDTVLEAASEIFEGCKVRLAAKVMNNEKLHFWAHIGEWVLFLHTRVCAWVHTFVLIYPIMFIVFLKKSSYQFF